MEYDATSKLQAQLKPVVYLDIDGVIFPYVLKERQTIYRSELYLESKETYDMNIVMALARAALAAEADIVLSSSRQQEFIVDPFYKHLVERLQIKEALALGGDGAANINVKAEAVLADQKLRPRRFAWVDDHLVGSKLSPLRPELKAQFDDNPNALLVVPNGRVGLTLEEIDAIGQFLRK